MKPSGYIFPFRRMTRPKSADPAQQLKTGLFMLFTGLTSHIIFFELLILLLKLELTYLQSILYFQVTGFPEIDMLTPLFIIIISPLLLVFTDPILFLISLLPWSFAGLLTSIFFGPRQERVILLGPPLFIGSFLMLISFLLYSLIGLGPGLPSTGLLILMILLVAQAISAWSLALLLSLTMSLPALIGYSLGNRFSLTKAVPPFIFFAQPDRRDPNQTKCPYLSINNQCEVGYPGFISNVCDNKFNQVTCSYYIRKAYSKKNLAEDQPGEYIDEIQ